MSAAVEVREELTRLLEEARRTEVPPGALCVRLARACEAAGDRAEAGAWLLRVVDAEDAFRPWQAAAARFPDLAWDLLKPAARTARVAIVGTYNTLQLVGMLRLAARRYGVELELYEGGYGQLEQELLAPDSGLAAFGPDYVVIAAHEGAVRLPDRSDSPADHVGAEAARWEHLWKAARARGARVVQHAFVSRPETPLGHLGARTPGSRESMLAALNAQLGALAGDETLLVDCERLAALVGKRRWFDDRYWHAAKQAVALDLLPLLARHTAAVIAGDLGLGRKCIALDLDDTLWGGVVGDDGLEGLRLGGDAEGEAYQAFQEYLLRLTGRGIVLAVCSKNDPAIARSVFEQHPEMRLRIDDIACFDASWDPKPEGLRRIAATLDLGLDAVVYIDDNPAEREAIRLELPEVEVVPLPEDPAGYVAALAEYPLFETSRLTSEDLRRTAQYRARAQAAELVRASTDMPSFWRDLEMEAVLAPVDELHLPRVVQLIGKTNQFNTTTRRHGRDAVAAMAASSEWTCLYAKLRDRFGDHGLVAVALAAVEGEALVIDTFLMSCRVIGRTLELSMLERLAAEADRRGLKRLRGLVVPTDRNEVVRDVYERAGFERVSDDDGVTVWERNLGCRALQNTYIRVRAG
jgi:FkbH-like protein